MNEAPKPKIPAALLAARPALADDPNACHPSLHAFVGDPPRKYSPGLHASIISNIEKGNRPHIAAAMAGLTSSTFHAWMRQGKLGGPEVHPVIVQFVEDVERACAVAEGNAVAVLHYEGEGVDAKTQMENAKWWLERSRADGYSKEANAKANAMIAEFLARLEAGLTPAEFQKVIAVATGQIASVEKQVFRLRPIEDDSQTVG